MRLDDAERERDKHFSPQDYLSTRLGWLAHTKEITRAQYEAATRWRDVYLGYLMTIGAPEPYGNSDGYNSFTDENCEEFARAYRAGIKILESCGKRVLHAVNSIAVYDEPEELGDYKFTLAAAKKGFTALALGK